MPYVSALADFRERVREVALQEKSLLQIYYNNYVFNHLYIVSPILQICDWLRDEVLVGLGVRLEDKKGFL